MFDYPLFPQLDTPLSSSVLHLCLPLFLSFLSLLPSAESFYSFLFYLTPFFDSEVDQSEWVVSSDNLHFLPHLVESQKEVSIDEVIDLVGSEATLALDGNTLTVLEVSSDIKKKVCSPPKDLPYLLPLPVVVPPLGLLCGTDSHV